MHLVSQTDQQVYVKALGRTFPFRNGETIHTENSYKYSLDRSLTGWGLRFWDKEEHYGRKEMVWSGFLFAFLNVFRTTEASERYLLIRLEVVPITIMYLRRRRCETPTSKDFLVYRPLICVFREFWLKARVSSIFLMKSIPTHLQSSGGSIMKAHSCRIRSYLSWVPDIGFK